MLLLRFGHLNKLKVSIMSFLIIFSIFIVIDYLDWSLSSDVYFWTLSTISQSIAALLGFIGIFVVLRFQQTQFKQNQLGKELKKVMGGQVKNVDEIQKFAQDSFFNLLQMDKPAYDEWMIQYIELCGKYIRDENKDDFLEVAHKLRNIHQNTKYYKNTILFPILLGAITMIFSILFLPFGEIEALPFTPLLRVGLIASMAISFIIVIVLSFIDVLHQD